MKQENTKHIQATGYRRWLFYCTKPRQLGNQAAEPTLPYPLAHRAVGSLFRPLTITLICHVAIVSDGLSLTTTQHPEAGGVECNV